MLCKRSTDYEHTERPTIKPTRSAPRMPDYGKPCSLAHVHSRDTRPRRLRKSGLSRKLFRPLDSRPAQVLRSARTLDCMEGGGTCRDVCKELGIAYEGRDLRAGFDATRAESFEGLGKFDFVWLHPPYWQMIRYNANSRCLSNAPTLEAFVSALRSVFANCRRVLSERGKLAVLMGDGKHEGRYMGLPFRTLNAAEAEGYQLAAPEIIRFGHGSTSSRRVYSTSFIPRLHDVCLVLEPTSHANSGSAS